MTPAISVVIVNFNAGRRLRLCLDSIVAHMAGLDWDAVVVDNCSDDDSAAAVPGLDRRISLLQNDQNAGFGRAVNQGVAATRGPLVLFLNPDARLLPGAIPMLAAELTRHEDCAVIGPAVLNDDGTIQGSGRGDPDMLTGLFGRTTKLTRWFPRSPLARRNVVVDAAPRDGQASVLVDWVSGACMLVRRSPFEALGGFDQRFFLYWEDADLCRRLRAAGWRTRYMPGATVAHTVGQSSRTAPAVSLKAFHRSAYLYYARHVARSPWNPLRWVAWTLLQARCRWQLLQAARASRERN